MPVFLTKLRFISTIGRGNLQLLICIIYISISPQMSHDLGAVTIFRFLEEGLGLGLAGYTWFKVRIRVMVKVSVRIRVRIGIAVRI